jgi:hypothetical protein
MEKTRQHKELVFTLLLAVFLMVPMVYAVPPSGYVYGGAGQYKDGNAGVTTTEITMSEGKLRMKGWAGSGGGITYGFADSWGYFGVYHTATQSKSITVYTTVAYDGAVYGQAYVFWIGFARAYIGVRQIIRVYDTSDWSLVTSNTYWIFDRSITNGKAERVWNGSTDKYGQSVTFTATIGKQYAFEVFVEAQCKTEGWGFAQANSMYNFYEPTQGYPNIIGYVKVQEISWYYAT